MPVPRQLSRVGDVGLLLVGLGRVGDVRAARVRVRRSIDVRRVHVNADAVVRAAEESDLAADVPLVVIHGLEAEAVVEEGLREGGVDRRPAGPLLLVRAVKQVVEEVEDRRIGHQLVGVVGGAGDACAKRELVVGGDCEVVRVAGDIGDALDGREGGADAAGEHLRGLAAGLGAALDAVVVAHDILPVGTALVDRSGCATEEGGRGAGRGDGAEGRVGADDLAERELALRVGVDEGLPVLEPRRVLVIRGEGAGIVGGRVTLLVLDADRGVVALAEDLAVVAQGGEVARHVVVRVPLLVELLVVHPSHADGQRVRDKDVVVVDRVADRAVAADAVGEVARARELGVVDVVVDDTTGAADAEQDRIRPALEVDATDVEAVPRDVRQEVVARVVGGAQAADAGRRGGRQKILSELRLAGLAGEVTIETRDFRVRGVDQEVHGVGGASVLQELGGHNGQRGRNVVQVGAVASAGQRAVRLVTAFFLSGINHERREDYGFLVRGRGRRRGRGCGSGRRGGRCRLVRRRRRLCERDSGNQRKTKRRRDG